MEPVFFKSTLEFRNWLEKNHQSETELIVGYYKTHTKKQSMTWSESVDEAICFGWIDGIRRSIDDESYSNRFTPRKPRSNWSAVNIKKVEQLMKLGKMFPAGMAAFEKRTEAKTAIYSYENKPEKLDEELELKFQKNPKAWEYFQNLSASYQRTMFYWVMSAKQETTKISRLNKLIEASQQNKRLL